MILVATAAFGADNNRNWVAVNIFDSIYPIAEDGTFVDSITSMETTIHLFTKRQVIETIKQFLKLPSFKNGLRSNEGHYLMWAHFSDDFIAKHPDMGNQVQPFMWMYPDGRHTDIFTAWSGNINLEALLTQGISGLGVPTKGRFQNFLEDVISLGDADFEGGWYMTDEQAERLLTTFNSYPGLTDGYSFVRDIRTKPNAPYEPAVAELVNGYNCGDYVFYALRTAGVLAQDVEESLKIKFWYPEAYYLSRVPLMGVGAKGAEWLAKNPGATEIPQNAMLGFAWFPLLFGENGMEFFDKKQVAQDLKAGWLPLNYARIWDQAHVIDWMRAHVDFRAKGIVTELLPAVQSGAKITSPDRTVPESPGNHYTLSRNYKKLKAKGDSLMVRKLYEAGASGKEGEDLRGIYQILKLLYPSGISH
jgi:hypothetical protein